MKRKYEQEEESMRHTLGGGGVTPSLTTVTPMATGHSNGSDPSKQMYGGYPHPEYTPSQPNSLMGLQPVRLFNEPMQQVKLDEKKNRK